MMKIINVRKLLSEINGLDVVKDMEKESGVKLIKPRINKTFSKRSIYNNNFGSIYSRAMSVYNYRYGSYISGYNTSNDFYKSEYNHYIYNSNYGDW